MVKRDILHSAAAALLMATSACASLPDTPIVPAETMFALGTEPFWALEITADRLIFTEPDAAPLVVRHRGERREGSSRVWTTMALSVRADPGYCDDGMSEREYSYRVSVRIGNGPRHLNGCAGAVQAPQR